jgi:hypothetical protein
MPTPPASGCRPPATRSSTATPTSRPCTTWAAAYSRVVLSDWDLAAPAPRADVLRLSAKRAATHRPVLTASCVFAFFPFFAFCFPFCFFLQTPTALIFPLPFFLTKTNPC